ncbi:MAG: hypothetical protein QM796_06915 [Chthoniobacteraceae bacterium]
MNCISRSPSFWSVDQGADLWQGLGIQAMWLAIMYGVAQLMWRRGVRLYPAVGG